MRRLIKRLFQFEKKKYLLTVDTDGVGLFMNCYEGSNEKPTPIKLVRFSPIENKVMDIIYDEYSSILGRNLRGNSNKLLQETRNYYDIDFPEWTIADLVRLSDKLNNEGWIMLTDENELLYDYLSWKEIKFDKFFFENATWVVSNPDKMNELENKVYGKIKEMETELKSLNELHFKIRISKLEYRDSF